MLGLCVFLLCNYQIKEILNVKMGIVAYKISRVFHVFLVVLEHENKGCVKEVLFVHVSPGARITRQHTTFKRYQFRGRFQPLSPFLFHLRLPCW